MSTKKSRLIHYNNINYNQYWNTYLYKKPLVNNYLKSKDNIVFLNTWYEKKDNESLLYSTLNSSSVYLNSHMHINRIYNVFPIFLKKYFNNPSNFKTYSYNIKININYKNIFYNHFLTIKPKKYRLSSLYKKITYTFKKRGRISYKELQNENKFLNRKVNLHKFYNNEY